MRSSSLLLAAVLLAGCSGGSTGGGEIPPPDPCTFTNPVASGADPWVVRHDGFYYLVQSRDGGIWVSRSDKLTTVVTNAVKVWTPPATGWNRENIWAPELHLVGGKWYIYYAAGPSGPAGATFSNQRSFVLESVGADPQGQYTDRGMLYTGDDVATGADPKWAIDLTVDSIGGKLYAVWSGWEQNTTTTDRVTQHLYIAPMSNPWTIGGNRVKLSSPTAPWEQRTVPDGLELEEGPELLVDGDGVFVVYSTHESWLPGYQLGQLRLTSGANPLDPASWTKSGPVFSGTSTVYGVGHASFTTSPDGTERWIVYHSKVSPSPGWDRVIRMQKFGRKADGAPDFGVPVPSGQAVRVPAGQVTAAQCP